MRLVAAATLLLALAACSSPAAPTTAESTTSTTSPTSGASTPTASPDESLTTVDLPAATPGAHTLLEVTPRTGSFRRDTVAASAGELRVLTTCAGEGNVVVSYRSNRSITFQCTSHQALTWNGPQTLGSADPLDVHVDAGAGVTWALRLEQG